MAAKKDNHRNERAKKIIAGRKTGGKADMKMTNGKGGINGLSGAAPTQFPATGLSPKRRMDKRKRYATGGGVDDESPKKKTGAKTEVNIVIAGKGDQGTPPPVGVPMPPPGAGAMPPPRPPMGGPPPGGMPPGAGMRPPGMMKRGGAIKDKGPKYPIEDGAGGGEGRLEKAAAQKKARNGRKDG